MKRRIVVLSLAVLAMTAGPAAVSGASAATTQSNDTILCVGNGQILGKAVCVPMIKR